MVQPKVSVIIPTLNSALVLEKCLRSIASQKYPKTKVEVIVVDGGSTDETLAITGKYGAKVLENNLKTAESGKAMGVRSATGDFVALIDSDNILPNTKWFSEMLTPFEERDIILSEPIRYTYRRSDPGLTRYFALLGMNDPICLFIGNYDRYSYVTNRWTDLSFLEEKKDGYLKVTLDREPIPTIGANGTIFRKKYLQEAIKNSSYLFDIDILLKIIRSEGSVKIAKVDTGIVHTFVEGDMRKFFRKQLRRINDMSYHKAQKNRDLDWEGTFKFGILKFILSCVFILPIFYQTLVGFLRKPDLVWIFHPIACYSTLFIYSYGWIIGKFTPRESNRKNWKQ